MISVFEIFFTSIKKSLYLYGAHDENAGKDTLIELLNKVTKIKKKLFAWKCLKDP